MPTNYILPAPFRLCALALALGAASAQAATYSSAPVTANTSYGGSPQAAGSASGTGAQADSPYRMRISDAQSYRLKKEENESYRLAPAYRAPEKDKPQGEDPVVAALSAAAQAEAAARSEAEMAAKPHARQIERAARAASLDPALVHALIYVESRHSAGAVSAKGAVGLMQVLPDTGARYGIDPARTTEQNLKAGTRYLRDLMRRFNDRLDLALAAYNAGEGAVERYSNKIPPYPETRDYVRAVLEKYSQWRSPVPPALASPAAPTVTPAGGTPPPVLSQQVIKPVAGSGQVHTTRLDSVTLPSAPAPALPVNGTDAAGASSKATDRVFLAQR